MKPRHFFWRWAWRYFTDVGEVMKGFFVCRSTGSSLHSAHQWEGSTHHPVHHLLQVQLQLVQRHQRGHSLLHHRSSWGWWYVYFVRHRYTLWVEIVTDLRTMLKCLQGPLVVGCGTIFNPAHSHAGVERTRRVLNFQRFHYFTISSYLNLSNKELSIYNGRVKGCGLLHPLLLTTYKR